MTAAASEISLPLPRATQQHLIRAEKLANRRCSETLGRHKGPTAFSEPQPAAHSPQPRRSSSSTLRHCTAPTALHQIHRRPSPPSPTITVSGAGTKQRYPFSVGLRPAPGCSIHQARLIAALRLVADDRESRTHPPGSPLRRSYWPGPDRRVQAAHLALCSLHWPRACFCQHQPPSSISTSLSQLIIRTDPPPWTGYETARRPRLSRPR